MGLRLKEVTWLRLISLLLWTLLVMVTRGASLLIDWLEGRVFDKSEQPSKVGEAEVELIGRATLLPPLDDELVLTRIWPLLHRRVNVSLMWRLRRVSRDWKRSVALTLEWSALEVVRIDSPGYVRFLKERGERRPALQERVEDELRSIKALLSECLLDYSPRIERARSKAGVLSQREDGSNSTEDLFEVVCPCEWKGFQYTDEVEFGSDSELSGRGEIEEESVVSTDSSQRVHYPRHQLRY